MDAGEVQAVLDGVFDQGIVHHGYVDYMRDYEVILYCTADPRTGVDPEHVRLLFKHCVVAEVVTAVAPEVWARSLDERLTSRQVSVEDLDGYVWGVRWQVMYPGGRVVSRSRRAKQWSRALDRPFHEVRIETNGHHLNLVFSEVDSVTVPTGYNPFTVGSSGPHHKFPL